MRKTLTAEMKQKYLDSKGVVCPFCCSHNIEADESVNVDAGFGSQSVHCNICDADWTDIYKLWDVEEQ